MMLVAICVT